MALLWHKQTQDTLYEVRTAGRSRRLYTNGVFHSQYHPDRAHSGGVWDLLVLPAFFRPPGRIKHVLLLGVGGGSVIHLLRRFVQPEEIIGVELSRTHLQIARQFFGIKKDMATLHHADAVDWLNAYDGPPFDLIIDDLFGSEGTDERAVPADKNWCTTLLGNLNKQGTLVMNFIGRRALMRCACITEPSVARHFKSAFQLSLPAYENRIGVFLGAPGSAKGLRNNIEGIAAFGRGQLDFRLRALGFPGKPVDSFHPSPKAPTVGTPTLSPQGERG
ncbi:MAG TPA: oxidoreductase [Gammaproteobacteria bacterium]|nr:oxidoreductase [Gammaproteobacteria bacterium]